MKAYIAKNLIQLIVILLIGLLATSLRGCWRTQLQHKDFKVTVGYIIRWYGTESNTSITCKYKVNEKWYTRKDRFSHVNQYIKDSTILIVYNSSAPNDELEFVITPDDYEDFRIPYNNGIIDTTNIPKPLPKHYQLNNHQKITR